MKRLAKWLLGLVLVFFMLVSAGLAFFYSMSFRLSPWDAPMVAVGGGPAPARPNILLLVSEDMSSHVGAFGNTVVQTPNLDRLAAEGVRYPNTFTTAGVCAPSRAALITGLYQIAMGGQHMRTATRPEGAYQSVPPAEIKAFPELLRAAGYYTFNTAKNDYQFSGAMAGSGPFTIWDTENDPALWRGRQEAQPFFGMINFMETHESGVFTPLGHRPNSFMHFMMQVMRGIMVQETAGEPVNPDEIELPPYYPDTPVIRSDIARHYENINAMDSVVGEILDRLEKDGLAASTIVIWTTDHGDGLPRAKRELYDSGIKVPMIIRWPEAHRRPGVHPGTIDDRLISFVDFAPTFLSWAEAPRPSYLQGHGFTTPDSSRRAYVFAARDRIDEVHDRQRAVRDDRYKYIRSWYPEQPGGHRLAFRDNLEMMKGLWALKESGDLEPNQMRWFEAPGLERLFDTEADPNELQDLSTDTTYARILTRMRMALDRWLEEVDDWSKVPENDMVERFQPNGQQEVTPEPMVRVEGGQVVITSPLPAASLGYRLGKGPWQLYTGPFLARPRTTITAKAVRYGWKESEPVLLPLR